MSDQEKKDLVNHPPHYNAGKFEVIDVIEDWKLPYHLGNVVKYVARAEYKGERLQDLKKALWYLNRYIEKLEKELATIPNCGGYVNPDGTVKKKLLKG